MAGPLSGTEEPQAIGTERVPTVCGYSLFTARQDLKNLSGWSKPNRIRTERRLDFFQVQPFRSVLWNWAGLTVWGELRVYSANVSFTLS